MGKKFNNHNNTFTAHNNADVNDTVDTSEIVKQNQTIDNGHVPPEYLSKDFSSDNKTLLERTQPKIKTGLVAGIVAGAASVALDMLSGDGEESLATIGMRAAVRGAAAGAVGYITSDVILGNEEVSTLSSALTGFGIGASVTGGSYLAETFFVQKDITDAEPGSLVAELFGN